MVAQKTTNRTALCGVLMLTVWLSACSDAGMESSAAVNQPAMGSAEAIVDAAQAPDEALGQTAEPIASNENEPNTALALAIAPTPTPAAPAASPPAPESENTPNTEPEMSTGAKPLPDTPDNPDTNPAPEPRPLPETDPTTQPTPDTEPTPEPEPTPDPDTTTSAAPEPEPDPPAVAVCSAAQDNVQNSTLYLINQARSVARMCGTKSFAAAPPLTWNSKLEAAALVHSTDMAAHNFFSHSGSDGSSSSIRATTQGYDWRAVGENIAAGQPTTEAVVKAWLESPGHCENIMNPIFEETAVVCVEDQGAQYRHYWTNALGTSF